MYLQSTSSYHIWHQLLTPISLQIGVASCQRAVLEWKRNIFFFSCNPETEYFCACWGKCWLARFPLNPGFFPLFIYLFFWKNAQGRDVTRHSFNKNYSKLVITRTNGDVDIGISLHLLWVSAIGFTALTIKIRRMIIRCSSHVMDMQMVSLRTAWKGMNYSPSDCSGWRKKKSLLLVNKTCGTKWG